MSTKIYNGFKLPLLPMNDLMERLKRFGTVATGIATKLQAKVVAAEAAKIIDIVSAGYPHIAVIEAATLSRSEGSKLKGSKLTIKPYIVSADYVMMCQDEIKKTGLRNPGLDFGCEVSILPSDDCLLAILYTEQDQLLDAFYKVTGATEYAYWDNSDKPNDVSDDEWDERSRKWDKALGDEGVPAINGLPYNATHGLIRATMTNVLAMLPTDKERVETVVEEIISEQVARDFTESGVDVHKYPDYRQEWCEGNTAKITVLKTSVHASLQPLTKQSLLKEITLVV